MINFLLVLIVRSLLLTILLPSVVNSAEEGRRIALVVGVGAYQHAPPLANPVNDARAIGNSLRHLNFDVVEVLDPDYRALTSAVREFGVRAAAADVALVYYAGHGVQVDRENYLIPADATLEREHDLVYEAMALDRLLDEVSEAKKIGIVLLDSCRNNPFVERVARSLSTIAGRAIAKTPGLARVDNVPQNTIVVMAAKADQIADDGVNHSPFAAALLEHLQIPGLELSLFFRSVRDTVLRATSNRQEPYVFSSLGATPFYFYPRPANHPPVVGAIDPLEVTDASGPTPLGLPDPTDPDHDLLTIRITGLPTSGEVQIDGHPASTNMIFTPEQIKTAMYLPGSRYGQVGSVDILVDDGRGGTVTASLPITVRSSHRPPIVSGPIHVHVAQQMLNIPPPTSPDADTLTITVSGLPQGKISNGTVVLREGDRLTPKELGNLTFLPDPGFVGFAGTLRYTVDNGHSEMAEGAAQIEVGVGQGALYAETPRTPLVTSPNPSPSAAVVSKPPELLEPDARVIAAYQRGIAAQRRGDLSGARRLYNSAATQNYGEAALALGRLYDPAYLATYTLGGAALGDVKLALKWYHRASDLGNLEAAQLLNAMKQ